MTYGDKLDIVSQYCSSTGCDKCKLNGIWTYGKTSCMTILEATEEELDWALHIIGEPHQSRQNNPYWERITQIADRQRQKGIDTYGQGLERNTVPNAVERIEYIQEELIDGLMYLEWLKAKLKGE